MPNISELEGQKLGAPVNHEGYKYPPKDWGVEIDPPTHWPTVIIVAVAMTVLSGIVGYLLGN
jgi:hypothetical protein